VYIYTFDLRRCIFGLNFLPRRLFLILGIYNPPELPLAEAELEADELADELEAELELAEPELAEPEDPLLLPLPLLALALALALEEPELAALGPVLAEEPLPLEAEEEPFDEDPVLEALKLPLLAEEELPLLEEEELPVLLEEELPLPLEEPVTLPLLLEELPELEEVVVVVALELEVVVVVGNNFAVHCPFENKCVGSTGRFLG